MIFYDKNDREIINVQVDDTSYHYCTIMGEDELSIKFNLAKHVELPIGCYCVFNNAKYTLLKAENVNIVHSRRYEYTLTLQSEAGKAKMWKFRNLIDGRLKFPLTAKPKEHLQLLVDNLNKREQGWSVGECIEREEKLINYDHAYCFDALTQMATEFNTEFEIKNKRVSLKKVEYNKENPLPLSYGYNNGLRSGVLRQNASDKAPVEVLFVQGGERNIDKSKYGSATLHLPKGVTLAFDGVKFEDEQGFNRIVERVYKTDDQGLSITRADKQNESLAEDSFDATSIYPSRVGVCSSVESVNNKWFDIVDNSIPQDLDFSKCLIAGETMTIIFQSGMLAGREFEVKYVHNKVGQKKARRFEIVPQEFDGISMPNNTFAPKVGDKYAIFHCLLPKSYINDSKTMSGAEWEMLRTAIRYMYDNEDAKFTFKGEIDPVWAKREWVNIGDKLKVGSSVYFSDPQVIAEGAVVRITGVKTLLNSPYELEIELSNKTISASVSARLNALESDLISVETKHQEAIQFTKRRFRDAKETAEMITKAMLSNFGDSISPATIQTMSMLVGDESLQFRFVSAKKPPFMQVSHRFIYDSGSKTFIAEGGIIQHMTLGIKVIKPQHQYSDYRFWEVERFASANLNEADKRYYLYIKANKANDKAVFLLSESAKELEGNSHYYFLVGVLNSEQNEERSFVTLYGFTEVLPSRITTDKIVSTDGTTYFDLVENVIAGRINFKDGIISGLVGASDENSAVNSGLNGKNDSANPVRIWAGASENNITKAPFRVYNDGSIYAENITIGKSSTFSGEVKGVTGSFKKLICVNDAGKEVGSIHFSNDGKMWFAGDMYHQGYNNALKRTYRFYSSEIWCRGIFGSRERATMVIKGDYGELYTNGLGDTEKRFVKFPFISRTLKGVTYYEVPLYGFDGDAAAFPVDLIIFSNQQEFTYELQSIEGKVVEVVNANDNASQYIFSGGFRREIKGGEVTSCVKVGYNNLTPAHDKAAIGAGWLIGNRDNDWR